MSEHLKAIEFVRSLEIDDSLNTTRFLATDGSKKGYVAAGSLVSFVSNLSGQQKEDVLNSSLLAQLASDKKYDKNKQTDEWYKYYTYVLGVLGWVMESFSFQEYSTSSQSLQVKASILDVLKAFLTMDELQIVTSVINSLQTSSNEPWWVVFNTKSTGRSANGNFQVAPVSVDPNGQMVIVHSAFYFTAPQRETRWMWFDYASSSIHFFKGVQKSTLNETVYAKVRQTVIDKLGDNAKKFIGDLDI